MTERQTRPASACRYLEVLEASWAGASGPDAVPQDVESVLAESVVVFRLVEELVRLRRDRVYLGIEEPNPIHDEDEKAVYIRWLALAEQGMSRLESLTKSFDAGLKGSLAGCQERARSVVAGWTPAAPARAVGSRMIEFSEEDAEQIYALLRSPAGAPGRPAWPPRRVPDGDPSLLR
jgi:hypothetical protein